MGGPDHLENHKFYRFQLKLAFGPHTPWKNLDPPPLKNDRPPLEPKNIIVFLKINFLCQLSLEPPTPPPPMTKIPGSAHDTTVKSTLLDAQAHLCPLASNALHVVKKKSEFPVRFFGFVTVYRGLLCTHWKFKTRKDMALSAISMNSALADKEFFLSLHHKLLSCQPRVTVT